MSKKTIVILIVSIVFVIVAACLSLYVNNVTKNNIVARGKEFTLPEEEPSNTKDLENITYVDFSFENENGDLVKLSESENMATMVLFWSPENEDSVEVLKKVDALNEKYESVKFYMINILEKTPKELEDKLSIDIYYDKLKEGTSKFYITELPSMIYIKKDNEVFQAKSGLTSTDALEANLDIISENF